MKYNKSMPNPNTKNETININIDLAVDMIIAKSAYKQLVKSEARSRAALLLLRNEYERFKSKYDKLLDQLL